MILGCHYQCIVTTNAVFHYILRYILGRIVQGFLLGMLHYRRCCNFHPPCSHCNLRYISTRYRFHCIVQYENDPLLNSTLLFVQLHRIHTRRHCNTILLQRYCSRSNSRKLGAIGYPKIPKDLFCHRFQRIHLFLGRRSHIFYLNLA